MTLHQNDRDKKNEDEMEWLYVRHLKRLGIDIQTFPTPVEDHYDFEVWVNGVYTTVLEVRMRAYTSEQVEKWGTLVVNMEKLSGLKGLFYKEKTKKWEKRIVLMNVTTDGWCYATDMETVLREWKNCHPATQEMMKTNHGSKDSGRSGRQIPIAIMEKWR